MTEEILSGFEPFSYGDAGIVEITSPGLLPPSIDYAAMESRQSDARNKVSA